MRIGYKINVSEGEKDRINKGKNYCHTSINKQNKNVSIYFVLKYKAQMATYIRRPTILQYLTEVLKVRDFRT